MTGGSNALRPRERGLNKLPSLTHWTLFPKEQRTTTQ